MGCKHSNLNGQLGKQTAAPHTSEVKARQKPSLRDGATSSLVQKTMDVSSQTQMETTNLVLGRVDFSSKQLISQASGAVHSAVFKTSWNGTPVALKCVKDSIAFNKELGILKRLRHPSIISYLGLAQEEGRALHKVNKYICLEYLNGGTLYDRLSNKKLPGLKFYEQSLQISIGILQALVYLHASFRRDSNAQYDSAIVHNDIKSPNILLDPTHTRGKLIDFTHSEEWAHSRIGTCTRISPQSEKNISLGLDNQIENNVSVYWTCPEKYKVDGIQSLDKSIKCDMFSLGIVFWEMITRRLPFGGVRREELAIIGYKYATGERPEMPRVNPKVAPASFIKVIENCILNSVDKIPEAASVLQVLQTENDLHTKKTEGLDSMPSSISISLDEIVSGINIERKLSEDDRAMSIEKSLSDRTMPVENSNLRTAKVFNFTSDVHVLVIDDSAFHRLALRHVLEVCGYRVTCCSSAADAFSLLGKDCRAYDCIMCDKNMPNMTGLEFVQQIKDSHSLRHIPIILVSVVEKLHDINTAIEHGADDYFIKPVKKNMVRTLILKLKQWQNNRASMNMWLGNSAETKVMSLEQQKQFPNIPKSDATLHNREERVKNAQKIVTCKCKPIERWQIPVLREEDIIASGPSCVTYKCEVENVKVAVKCYHSDATEKSERNMLLMQKEFELFQSLQHPNIVEIVGTVATQNEVWLISKYMKYGSLRDILSNQQIPLSFALKVKIAHEVAKGLKYLHSNDPVVVHRDLKAANILLGEIVESDNWYDIFVSSGTGKKTNIAVQGATNPDLKPETALTTYLRTNINRSVENLSVRLCDFGLSSTLDRSFLLSTRCGSPAWIAPEVMVGKRYDQRIDIYAFGIVMWEIMERGIPFQNETTSVVDLITKVCEHSLRPKFKDKLTFETQAENMVGPASADKTVHLYSKYCQLAFDCWTTDQNQRPSMDYILNTLQSITNDLDNV